MTKRNKPKSFQLTDLQIFRLFAQRCKHQFKETVDKKYKMTAIAITVPNNDIYTTTFDNDIDDAFAYVTIYSHHRSAFERLFDALNTVPTEPVAQGKCNCDHDCNNEREGEENEER